MHSADPDQKVNTQETPPLCSLFIVIAVLVVAQAWPKVSTFDNDVASGHVVPLEPQECQGKNRGRASCGW